MGTLSTQRNRPILSWLIFLIIAFQNPPWFIWSYAYPLLYITVIMLLLFVLDRLPLGSKIFNSKLLVILSCLLFFVVFNSVYSFRTSSLMTWISFLLLFVIKDEEKTRAMKILTTYLSLVVSISLLGWLVNNYVFSLPQIGFTQMEKMGGEIITLKNFLIFVEYDNDYIKRFYSVFDEPGVLGTLSAFVLFINKYNYKDKRLIIIFLGGIFTFSIAFILLTLIGLFITYSKNVFSVIKLLVLGLVLGLFVLYFFQDNLAFQNSIIERSSNISSSTEKRTSDLMNEYFDNFIQSSDIILGKGTSFVQDNKHIFQGQGYQFFFIEYGLFGLIILGGMYLSMINNLKKLYLGLLLLFCLSFIQRPFLFTPWQVALFSIGLATLKQSTYSKPQIKLNKQFDVN